MLGERHAEREAGAVPACTPRGELVRQAEAGPVRGVQREAGAPPVRPARHGLAEDGDVR